MNIFTKINWKVLLAWVAIVFVINIDTKEQYPAAAALGTATGVGIVNTAAVLLLAKGKKDYVTE